METFVEPEVQSPEYDRAHQRAEMLQGFYIHALIYLVINAGLFAINFLTRGEGGSWWFQWPLLLWGLGLGIHALTTVVPVFSSEWVDRKADDLVKRR